MEENVVKRACEGVSLDFNIKKDEKVSIENLMRDNILIENLTRCKNFLSKSDALFIF